MVVVIQPVTLPQAVPAIPAVFDGASAGTESGHRDNAAADAALGESLRVYASRELRHARKFLSWRQAWLHKGVHQGRKSLRRVRSTLALAAAAMGRAGELIDIELQRINRSLSDLRDGHALVEALDRLKTSGAASGHTALLARVRRAAIRRRAELGRHAVRPGGACKDDTAVITLLMAGLQTLPWAEVHSADVLRAVEDSARQVTSAGLRALASGDDDDWHRWRRRARRLTQQDRALDRLPVPLCSIDEHHKQLAELLGEVQDFSLLSEHCGAHSPFAKADRRALRALAAGEVQRLRAGLRDKTIALTAQA